MTAVERVVARARAELGYTEKKSKSQLDDKTANAGSNNYTKYARDLDEMGIYNGKKNGYDWCDVFADWCFIMEFGEDIGLEMICQPEKSYGAGVNNSARYYRNQIRLDKNPQVGDQVYFIGSDGLYYHTGIVVAVDATTVTTIEGNAGKGSTQVVETVYKRTNKKLGAFGHPKFELVPDNDAVAPSTPVEPTPVPEIKPATPATTVALKKGDKVRLTSDALVYGKDYKFSSWVYKRDLYVYSISGDKVRVGTSPTTVTGSVHIKYLTKDGQAVENKEANSPVVEVTPTFKVGDMVELTDDALVYGKDYRFSSWVYNRTLYVISVLGNRVRVGTSPRAITGSVHKKHLTKVR